MTEGRVRKSYDREFKLSAARLAVNPEKSIGMPVEIEATYRKNLISCNAGLLSCSGKRPVSQVNNKQGGKNA